MSLTLNKPCIVEGFYDAHDVWHFLSACGMFFAFLVSLLGDKFYYLVAVFLSAVCTRY